MAPSWKDLGLHIPKIEVPLKSKSDQLLEKLEGAGLGEFELEKIISDDSNKIAEAMLVGMRAQMLGIDLDKAVKLNKGTDKKSKVQEPSSFIHLDDLAVPPKHQPILVKYRLLAADHGVPTTTPVCYKVTAGFTLKTHAPKAGPCHDNFSYLQNWDFQDEPTADCFVFLLPRLLFTGRTKNQQIKLLSDLHAKLELPAHHLSGFGKATLVTGLILAHFKATGERIPLNNYWVRTDTCRADGIRLALGNFDDTGLLCDYWYFDGNANGLLGVFALGVETLGH